MVHHGCAVNRIEQLEAQLKNELSRAVEGRFNTESGRKGGQKGGRVRAARLSPEARRAIAQKAGKSRQEKLRRKKQAGVVQR